MNLTELRSFADLMAEFTGQGGSGGWTLANHEMGRPPVELETLQNTLPVDRALLSIRASARNEATNYWLDLRLGSPSQRAELVAAGGDARLDGSLAHLAGRWAELGQPRRSWELLYPGMLLAAVAIVVGAPVTGWFLGAVSAWLLPAVVAVGGLLYLTGAPLVRGRVQGSRRMRQGLVLDHGTMQKVAEERATRLWALAAGLSGATLTAVVAIAIAILNS
jgi:hypothetical protein